MRLVEKYRPTKWEEVIGQQKVISSIREILKRGFDNLPHFLFTGKPGTGKTTVAQLIARELWGDKWRDHYVELNASDERGIETVRNLIKSITQLSGQRLLLLDEADMMTFEAQHSLRRIMETTKSTVFILTANQGWRIIEPIRSRCVVFNFEPISKDDILLRICQILKAEGIIPQTAEEESALIKLAEYANGDLRWAINTLESLIGDGKIKMENIEVYLPLGQTEEVLNITLQGNLQQGVERMKELLAKIRPDDFVSSAYDWIGKVQDVELRARLWTKLSEIEQRIRLGGNPHLHLTAFLAWVWALPHMRKEVMKDEAGQVR